MKALPLLYITLYCLLLAVACSDQKNHATTRAKPAANKDQVFVTSNVVDHLPAQCHQGAFACHIQVGPTVSEIWILKDYYPECLAHEMRHAHEGQFHPGKESIEDC